MRSSIFFSVVVMALCAMAQTFTNPIIWEDLADNEVHRVDDTFYMTASTMHYSPGAPILRPRDLVNWEYFSHSVPSLDWGTKYDLVDGQRAYIKGIWASSLRHRASNGLWCFVACIEFSKTYIYTASNPAGPWTRAGTIDNCYYDVGLMFDDNDTPYVAYRNTAISVAQLSADGLSEVRSEVVYNTPSSIGALEGSRMYKRNGNYYIFLTRPPDGQYVLQSSSPWGPYTQARNTLSYRIRGPIGTGTVHLDVANMADGDRAGLAALRDQSSLIGIERSGDAYDIILMGGIDMNSDWTTASTGTVVQRQSLTLSGSKEVYLSMKADIRPGGAGNVVFSYSTDGQTFTTLGSSFALHNDWQFFMGYRYGIFNYATKALGGSVRVASFTSEAFIPTSTPDLDGT
ncbi:putative beta-xylosidase [Colletotrichum sp. SAR11_59]|nr:putative beta-xylosidase [Colletotrichum sp. SAR11_59]